MRCRRVVDRPRGPRGVTLVELLVVVTIVVIVSAVALATVLPALGRRQASEAGRLLQASLAGARDQAIRTGQPAGIRLLPDPVVVSYQPPKLPNGNPNPQAGWIDPVQPIAYNRVVPIGSPASYNTGQLSVFDDGAGASSNYSAAIRTVNGQPGVPCLVVEMDSLSGGTWFWNIRVGEEIQINNAGPWYTIVGPMVQPNPEGFVNIGPPGTALPTLLSGSPSEYLLLTNKRDDGRDADSHSQKRGERPGRVGRFGVGRGRQQRGRDRGRRGRMGAGAVAWEPLTWRRTKRVGGWDTGMPIGR